MPAEINFYFLGGKVALFIACRVLDLNYLSSQIKKVTADEPIYKASRFCERWAYAGIYGFHKILPY
jgi:hypothetical protein